MKIHDISIKNFRGIKKLKNLKAGDINSFVGKNDSGKSTILKALDAFFNEKFASNDVFKGKEKDEKTEIIIRFTPQHEIHRLALDSEGKICIRKIFHFNPNNGRVIKDINYICHDIASDTIGNLWGIKESDINKQMQELELEFSKSGRGVTNLSKIEAIDEHTQETGRVKKEYPADEYIKNLRKQYDFFDIPEFSLFDAEQDLNIGSTSFQSQFKPIATKSLDDNFELTEKLEKNVQSDLENEFKIITNLMQKNVPDLELIKPNVSCNWNNLVKFDLSLKFSAENYEIPIGNKGTGFKRLLMVAYFEYLASLKSSKKYQIFGIEEPETFLHPELQNDLLDSIIALSDESQFFITTHSPIFAGATKNSNIIVVKKENEISNYLNFENEDEILDLVIKELGIRPNYNLLNDNYRKIIFVEGSGDVKFWNIALEKINNHVPDDILFIPCGGDQVEFFVNAKLCRKIGRKFLFILDSDKGAVDYENKLANKKDLIKKIEDMGGEVIILRKREIENYYSRDAMQRILGDTKLPEEFKIEDFNDIKEQIKLHVLPLKVNFKAKNNFTVFDEMTKEEWQSAAFNIEDGKTDIELIISKILE
ncbi:ATP-dependent endonuclease [Flavobacterium sp. MK4S-17]|uniref:ATP-dependent nuclease n=1 Tax=Flavobacterium sp. MK4S-17 TaxID=2543737 RepID=UPI00135AE05B|nr:AAA family ATPase [Flavobacterium sp. MK4S-17]